MKKRSLIPYIICLLALHSFFAKAQKQDADLFYLKHCLQILAADSMAGREPGTANDLMAAKFVSGEFQTAKLRSCLPASYFQEFTFTKDSAVRKTRNVVAVLNNKAPLNIIIGAHYDHLGWGGARSRSYGRHQVHNGADDNASGVALMLALARQLRNARLNNYNYWFVAFSGHEDGLYGSDYFVKSRLVADSSISLMINLDMVGRAEPLEPKLFVGGSDSLMTSRFKNSVSGQIAIKIFDKTLSQGDHSAFASHNIPVLYLTTGIEDDYHKVSDDESLINYQAMMAVQAVVIEFLRKLNTTP